VTNGISDSTGGGSFNCTCPPGWTGDTCQISKTLFSFFLYYLNAFQLISIIPPGSFTFVVCSVMSCCLSFLSGKNSFCLKRKENGKNCVGGGGESGGRREQVNFRETRKEGKEKEQFSRDLLLLAGNCNGVN
jgi:hypothetical protein